MNCFLYQNFVMTAKLDHRKVRVKSNVLLVWTSFLLVLTVCASGSGRTVLSCHKLKTFLESMKDTYNVPLEPIKGKFCDS